MMEEDTMRKSKRILSLILALAMCFCMTSVTAFAAEVEHEPQVVSDGMDYACLWVPAGTTKGVFEIEKTFSETGHITFKARSSNTSRFVNMCLTRHSSTTMGASMSITGWVSVDTDDTDHYPANVVEGTGKYYVQFEFPASGNPNGVFLMCWIYR